MPARRGSGRLPLAHGFRKQWGWPTVNRIFRKAYGGAAGASPTAGGKKRLLSSARFLLSDKRILPLAMRRPPGHRFYWFRRGLLFGALRIFPPCHKAAAPPEIPAPVYLHFKSACRFNGCPCAFAPARPHKRGCMPVGQNPAGDGGHPGTRSLDHLRFSLCPYSMFSFPSVLCVLQIILSGALAQTLPGIPADSPHVLCVLLHFLSRA